MALPPTGHLLSRDSRTMRWAVLIGAAAMVFIGVVLMLLLTVATNNRQMYEQHYGNLFAINVAMAAVLLLVILFIAVRLLVRLRRKRFGSRLLVKLAAVFALVGFVPGMLIYIVSYQFVSRSIARPAVALDTSPSCPAAARARLLRSSDSVSSVERPRVRPASSAPSTRTSNQLSIERETNW